MPNVHHRAGPRRAAMGQTGSMDGPQNVLALPQAPDAIELRHLRAFVAVADDLSFSRAAQRLFISQPALSRQIRGLERLVGCDLFRRSTQRVELTLAGEALLTRARALLADLDDAISVTRSVGGELAGRMALLWEPWARASVDVADLDAIRATLEELHAKFTPPPDVTVAPVIAGGVPALRITPETSSPAAALLYLHGGGHVAGSAFGYPPPGRRHRHRGAGARAGHRLPAGPRAPLSRGRAGRGQRLPVAARHRRRRGQDRGGRRLVSGRPGHVPAAGPARARPPDARRGRAAVPVARPDRADAAAAAGFPAGLLAGRWPTAWPRPTWPATRPTTRCSARCRRPLAGLPPLLIHAASGDAVLQEAQLLARHATQCGVDARIRVYPVPTHDFHIFWSFLPEARDAIDEIGRFVRTVTSTPGESAAPQPG